MEEDLELTPHSIGGMAETYRQQMLTKETENHQLRREVKLLQGQLQEAYKRIAALTTKGKK